MANSVSTNIKIDPELKKEAQDLFSYLGLSMTAAINMFLRQAVMEQALPFRPSRSVLTAETIKAIESAENDADMHGPYDSVSAMMEDLNA